MEFDPKITKKRLKKLDQDGFLRVYKVNQFVCGFPGVVFDPESSEPVGFNLYYHPGSRKLVSVAKMDPTALADWKEFVWEPLEDDEDNGKNRRRIFFEGQEGEQDDE